MSILFFSITVIMLTSMILSPVQLRVHFVSASTAYINNSPQTADYTLVQYGPSSQMMTPQQQFMLLRQNFANFEQQLGMSNTQQQQYMIAGMQNSLYQSIAQANPTYRYPLINIVQQAMSPTLSQLILNPVVGQLQQYGFLGGVGSTTPTQPGTNPGGSQIDPKDMEACLKGEMPVSSTTPEYCEQILNPNPAVAADICGYLGRVHVPVPGC